VTAPAVVRVVRSGFAESVHVVDVAVADADGRLTASAGDPHRQLFARSSMKPLQAAVSLSLAALDFTDREVSVMCASHNSEPVHLEAVRAVLHRGDVSESALQTPPRRPWDEVSREADPTPRRINSDCSGKHAGMLAASRSRGWPLDTYRHPGHPVQDRVMNAVLSATDLASAEVGVDGCGVPVHRLPLLAMATIYARLARPERLGPLAPHSARAVRAMLREPYLVAGRDRVDTAIMRAADSLVVKSGAEGLICAALVHAGLGVAVRVRDGSARGTGPVLIETLRLLGALDAAALQSLAVFIRPPVLGGGEPVGEVVPSVELVTP
jgi:L-asparaginase II